MKSQLKLKRKEIQLKNLRQEDKELKKLKRNETNEKIDLGRTSEERRTCVGSVKGRYAGFGYPLKEMSKANRPGQYPCSGIWCFFVLNSLIWLFSYLGSTFCPIYNLFVFAFLSFPLVCYSYGSAQSTITFLLFGPNTGLLFSQIRLILLQ